MNQDLDFLKKRKYYAKPIENIFNGQGYWNSLRVGIFEQFDQSPDQQIGEYIRNYSSMYNTFVPFFKNGQWYALYSKDYTATTGIYLHISDQPLKIRNSYLTMEVESEFKPTSQADSIPVEKSK